MEVKIPNTNEAIELLATPEIYELDTRIPSPEEDAEFLAELQSATEWEVIRQLKQQLSSNRAILFKLAKELTQLIDGHKKDNDEDPLFVATACSFLVPVVTALCELREQLREELHKELEVNKDQCEDDEDQCEDDEDRCENDEYQFEVDQDQFWPHPIEDINKKLEDLDPGQQKTYKKLFVDARGRARWIDAVLDDCKQQFSQLKSDRPGLTDLELPLILPN